MASKQRHTLYWSANSPYVRKVLVAIQEYGCGEEFECISAGDFILTGKGPSPISTTTDIDQFNPAARIPTLLCPDGSTYFGSQAIEQYLEYKYAKGELTLYRQGEKRLQQIMLESIADGLLDSALQLRYETTIRPEELRWKAWQDGWQSKITRSLDALSPRTGKWPLPDPNENVFPIGGIAVAAALWYLDARFSDVINWRKDDELLAWYEKIQQRRSWQGALAMKPDSA